MLSCISIQSKCTGPKNDPLTFMKYLIAVLAIFTSKHFLMEQVKTLGVEKDRQRDRMMIGDNDS